MTASRVKLAMKAKKRLKFFNPAASLCPICERKFSQCSHTETEARLLLKRDVLATGCKRI